MSPAMNRRSRRGHAGKEKSRAAPMHHEAEKVTGTALHHPNGGLPVRVPLPVSPRCRHRGRRHPAAPGGTKPPGIKSPSRLAPWGCTPRDLTPRKRPRARARNLVSEHRRTSPGCRRDAGWDGAGCGGAVTSRRGSRRAGWPAWCCRGAGETPSCAGGERGASGQGSATRAGWQAQGSSPRCHEYTQ